ncbi:MAG: AbrB/MazE/SpoVT family DNA-binding domain-containing protein [Proteobacteria bacterium]|nr:AbrB/MazE/SpoVT family DNA-binding domain-containing protein [Pseudomonadota bacterium]
MPYFSVMAQNDLTITTKGQVTLRKEVLRHLGVTNGKKVSVEMLPNGVVQLRAKPTGKISDVFGMLKRPGQRAISIEEMNQAIAEGWAGKR